MKKKILLSLLGSTLLVAQNIELESISITSTTVKTDELRSTEAIEIYTYEDIKNSHVQNIYEFLNSRTSVLSMPSYGNPFVQKLDMRGYGIGDGYQNIVVKVDGRRINNIDMVAPLLSSISVASIERLEIIKSSGIVTGGDGANAGSINIITKKDTSKEIGAYIGTYGLADASFYMGYSDSKLSASISGESQKSDGIRSINAGGDKDENSAATATLNLSYMPNDKLELRSSASFARTDVIYGSYLSLEQYDADPSGASSNSASDMWYDTNAISAGASYYLNDRFAFHLDASHESKQSNYSSLSTAYIYNSHADYDYNSLKAAVEFEVENIFITGGTDLFYGRRDSNSHYDNLIGFTSDTASITDKDNTAFYLAADLNYGAHTFKAGYRQERVEYSYKDAFSSLKDNHSLHGAELGYNYTADDKNSFFVGYARTYQAPDIDRFFSYGAFNGFIVPMKTHSFSAGYNNIDKSNKFKLSLFYTDLKDEIYYYSDPAFLNSKNTNIDKSHKYGLDLYDRLLLGNSFDIVLNYSYVVAKIDTETENGEDYSGNYLPGVSNHNVKATLNYEPLRGMNVALTQTYRSKAYAANDFNNDFTQKQGAYRSTDISLSYTKDALELFAKINNLFDKANGMWIQDDAIYPVNFTTTASAGFKLRF